MRLGDICVILAYHARHSPPRPTQLRLTSSCLVCPCHYFTDFTFRSPLHLFPSFPSLITLSVAQSPPKWSRHCLLYYSLSFPYIYHSLLSPFAPAIFHGPLISICPSFYTVSERSCTLRSRERERQRERGRE